MRRLVPAAAAATLVLLLSTLPAAAQQAGPISLADALRIAAEQSEAVEIARAGEARADAQEQQAFSQRFPQLNFAGGYTRTLASEFSSAFDSTGPVCDPLLVDPSRPLEERVGELERAASCGSIGMGGAFDFSNLPFGQRNIYQLGLEFSQALYAGGRIDAQGEQARLARESAALTTSIAEGQLALDVTRAFYDAALADRLVAIAESVYAQADATVEQTRLAYEAGRQPEFELLRAQVERDNQRPVVIRRRADRDLAYLHLRQLLEWPASTPLVLDVDLERPDLPAPLPFADELAAARASDEPAADPAVPLNVRQSETVVAISEQALRLARAERLPSIALTSSLSGVGYPSNGVFPTAGDFRANWTVGALVQVPILTGGRLRAGARAAEADLTEARAALQRAREIAELDRASALQDLEAAEAAWAASAGTVEQAQRAYEIAELRNREGLSTQLELSDARVSLEMAQANRVQAARDVQVARARVALLPSLPAGAR